MSVYEIVFDQSMVIRNNLALLYLSNVSIKTKLFFLYLFDRKKYLSYKIKLQVIKQKHSCFLCGRNINYSTASRNAFSDEKKDLFDSFLRAKKNDTNKINELKIICCKCAGEIEKIYNKEEFSLLLNK